MKTRGLRTLILLALIPLLSGCVYLRLNKLRLQMADFQKYAVFLDDPGPGLMLKEPVLLPGDLNWLTGLEPSKKEGDKDRSILSYELVKRPAKNTNEKASDLRSEALFMFANDKLARVQLPEQYNAILNGHVIAQLMKRADKAEINQGSKAARWKVEDSSILPGMNQIRRALGHPSKLQTKDGEIILTYWYDLVGTDKPGPEVTAVFAYDLGDYSFMWGTGDVGKIHVRNQNDGTGNYQLKLWRK